MTRFSTVLAGLVCLTTMASAQSAAAKDRVSNYDASLKILQHGVPVAVQKSDREQIKERLMDLFNSHEADSERLWLRENLERDGMSLQEKWHHYQTKSIFEVTYENNAPGEEPPERVRVYKFMQVIQDNPDDGFFGPTLAMLNTGEVKAYDTAGKERINLYCFDQALKYLPDHYKRLHEKYDTPTYQQETGISCSADTYFYYQRSNKR